MATQNQRRQRENRAARAAAAAAARQKKAERKRLAVVVFTAMVLILGVSVFVAGSGKEVETASPTTTTPVVSRPPAVLTPVPAGAAITGDTPCPKGDGSSARTTSFAKPPPTCISPSRSYSADVNTTKGRFTVALDAKGAPNTVNNFVVLARYHYYDGVAFHRIIPGFVVQGGDPQATGSGGPGYKFDDELPKAGTYKLGSVAMANNGANTNTNGSQFFVITGDAGVALPPYYSLFGQVTEGFDVVKAIESAGTPATATEPGGKPTEVIKVSSITIKET